MDWLAGAMPIVAGVLGLAWGSFVGVLASRGASEEPIARGRSRCDACGATIAARDLVPIVSWLLLRGRCRACGSRIPATLPAFEVATAGLFAVAATVAPDGWAAALVAPFLGILLGLTAIDLEHRRLPNRIVYPTSLACAAWIVVARAAGGALDPVGAGIGAVAFGGGLLAVTLASRGGMGLGDVKLAALIGLVVGAVDLPSVAVAAGAAVLLGGAVAAVALLRG
ncbi:MAG: prepilin peptidase, partial [Actinomycetota bacterium]